MSSVSEVEFLRHETTLWDKPMGVPLHSDSDLNPTQNKKFDGRFTQGKYTFPFSFPFPSHPNTIPKPEPPCTNFISPFDVGQSPTSAPRERIHRKEKEALRPSDSKSSNVSPQTDLLSPQMQTPSSPSSSTTMSPSAHQGLPSPLPQSFLEKGINLNISYEISVRITHGRFRGATRSAYQGGHLTFA